MIVCPNFESAFASILFLFRLVCCFFTSYFESALSWITLWIRQCLLVFWSKLSIIDLINYFLKELRNVNVRLRRDLEVLDVAKL